MVQSDATDEAEARGDKFDGAAGRLATELYETKR
jgi:hypothetical protein